MTIKFINLAIMSMNSNTQTLYWLYNAYWNLFNDQTINKGVIKNLYLNGININWIANAIVQESQLTGSLRLDVN